MKFVVPTRYRGVEYRSRTEARWAVFFDAVDAQATYEPESYNLDGIWYLPDFFVSSWNLFVEIKGPIPTPLERDRCRKLCLLTKKPVFLISDAPGAREGHLYLSGYEGDLFAAFALCRNCGGLALEYWAADDTAWGSMLFGTHENWDRCGDKIGGDRRFLAIERDLTERFGVYPKGAA